MPSASFTTDSTALPPSVQEILAITSPSVDTLIINTMFSSFLVPLAIALFVMSTHKWKTLIFSLNIAVIILGFAYGAFNIYFQRTIANLHPIDLKLDIVVEICLYFFIPLCTQSILFHRVFAVYPPQELTWWRNVMIYGTFGTLTVARLANAIVDFVYTGRLIRHTSDVPARIITEAWKPPFIKVEFVLQLFHNALASTLFLARLRDGGALQTRSTHADIFTSSGRSSYTTRLKGLFWIATFNFVFPVILNIVMIIFLFYHPNIVRLDDATTINVFVDIICVILATVWCSGTYWQSPTLRAGLGTNSAVRFADEARDSLASITFAPTPAHVQIREAEMSEVNQ